MCFVIDGSRGSGKVLLHKSKDWNYMDDAYSSKKFKLEAVECKGTSIQLDADM
jgi:hypothetical protein